MNIRLYKQNQTGNRLTGTTAMVLFVLGTAEMLSEEMKEPVNGGNFV